MVVLALTLGHSNLSQRLVAELVSYASLAMGMWAGVFKRQKRFGFGSK